MNIIRVLDQQISLKVILIVMFVWFIVGLIMTYYFFGGVKEGFEASWRGVGAALNYKMGDGVKSSWENISTIASAVSSAHRNNNEESADLNNLNEPIIKDANEGMFENLEGNAGGQIPLNEGELLFFDQNKFSPDCCPSDYSNSSGCVCATPEQADYLNKRAGNKTFDDGF
jgi:hypothetical protein